MAYSVPHAAIIATLWHRVVITRKADRQADIDAMLPKYWVWQYIKSLFSK